MSKAKDKDPVFESLSQALEYLFPNYHEQKQKKAVNGGACSWNADASPLRAVTVLSNQPPVSGPQSSFLGG